jgi:hypothetical protein
MGTRAGAISIFAVPYDSGHRGVRMGRGPEHLLSNDLEDALAVNRREVRSEILEAPDPFRAEISTAFELFGEVAHGVREAAGSGAFPLVLSGNCNATVGAVAGLAGAAANEEESGIVWFDGHTDFNTPETTSTGSLDGMGLAIAVGQGWANMTHTIPYFRLVQEANVVFVGGRDAWGGTARMCRSPLCHTVGHDGRGGTQRRSGTDRTPDRPRRREGIGDQRGGGQRAGNVRRWGVVTTAIANLVGVIIGSVLTALLNLYLQREADKRRWKREDELQQQQWKREDQTRFQADRMRIYRDFLVEARRARNLEPTFDEERMQRMVGEIELISGSSNVV